MPSLPEEGGSTASGGSPAPPRIPRQARMVVLVGPTAVGKTAVAVDLAEHFQGEIVSLDSRQLVRRLEIGTAKPSAEERRRARHHLVDVADPAEPWPLTRVVEAARRAVTRIHDSGALPILAGGTGQYVWAILEGWRIPSVPPDPAFRARMAAIAEREGHDTLHARLEAIDPMSAAEIDARNVRRVIRALEIHHHTGQPKSVVAGRDGPPCPMLILGLTRGREALYARVDARIDAMLAAGLEEEVRALVADGIGFDLPAMSSLGYREWRPLLAGEIDRDEVVRQIRANTRRLVRTQANWFGPDDARIQWLDLEQTTPAEIRGLVASFLSNPKAPDRPRDNHMEEADS